MGKKIVIIGKDNCGFCRNALQLSTARKIPHKYLNVPDDLSVEEAFKMAEQPFATYPCIFIADENDKIIEFIGGFTEYRAKSSTLNLD